MALAVYRGQKLSFRGSDALHYTALAYNLGFTLKENPDLCKVFADLDHSLKGDRVHVHNYRLPEVSQALAWCFHSLFREDLQSMIADDFLYRIDFTTLEDLKNVYLSGVECCAAYPDPFNLQPILEGFLATDKELLTDMSSLPETLGLSWLRS